MKRVKRNLVSECKMHKWSNNSNNETECEFASMVCVRAKLRKLHHLSFSLCLSCHCQWDTPCARFENFEQVNTAGGIQWPWATNATATNIATTITTAKAQGAQ